MTLQAQEPRTAQEPKPKLWTREEFYELAEQGYFRGKRVQLIDGEIFEMAPQGHPHAKAVTFLNRWATTNFPPPALVRIQMPLNASARSDPEPDVAIVPDPSWALTDHPESAVLVIEVSDSSLRLDRRKAAIYAAAGVPEYWLVNVGESQVEVFRDPRRPEKRYEQVSIAKGSDVLSPQSRPEARLAAAELFA
jgi:Uma2 family endonuclease